MELQLQLAIFSLPHSPINSHVTYTLLTATTLYANGTGNYATFQLYVCPPVGLKVC